MDSKSFHDGCSQDQQGDHWEQKTFLMKTLIIQSNCHPSQQFSIKVPYNSTTRQLDLGQGLYNIFQQMIPSGHQYQVFYYSRQCEYFIFGGMYPFQDYLFLSEQYASQEIISVKIIRTHPPIVNEIPEVLNKKKRITYRTIHQVLQKVAEWRWISKEKGITLQDSAKQINLPKKTLDDYFYQIRQGQYYGFNFQQNQNQRIGVLRKFVKQNHKKKPEKPIKILQQFMIESNEGEGEEQEEQEEQDQQQFDSQLSEEQ